MLDIKRICSDPESIKAGMAKRGNSITPDRVIELEGRRKDIINEVEQMKAQKNAVSKEVGRIKKEGGDAEAIMAEGAAGVIGISAPYLIAPETYDNYVSMGIMTSDVEPDPYIVANAAYGVGKILVSANTEYPEVCMRFLDYLYTDEGVLYSSYGPVSSSEDTLGLIEGYTILDENLNYTEGDHGYASNYEYRLNRIILWDGQIRQDLADTLWTEWGTGKEVEAVELNPSSGPNDYYLYSIVEAFEGYEDYLVVIRPEAYATTEQSVRFTDLQTSIRAYVDAETAKFIIGERALDTFDDYYADLKAMGGDELMELAREMYVGYEAETK